MSPRRSLVLSFAQVYTVLCIRVFSVAVLSRLLTPGEFGVFAAAAALVGLGYVLADSGAAQFLISRAKLTSGVRRTALGVMLLTHTAAAALVALLVSLPTPLLDSAVRAPTLVLAAALLVNPPGMIGSAVLQREMRFGILYGIGVCAALASVLVAVALAWHGYGVMSLAYATLVESAITACALLLGRSRATDLLPSLRNWRSMLGFGVIWTGINTVRQTGDALIRLAVGAVLGYQALGLLSRAQTAVGLFDRLITEGVSPVLLPALSSRLHGGGELRTIYLKKLAYLSVTAWPFFGFIGLCAEPLVRLMLGPGWDAAVGPVRILSIAGLFVPFSSLVLPFFVAVGNLKDFLPVQVATQVAKLVLVLVAIGFASLELVCAALAFEGLLKAILVRRMLASHLEHSWAEAARPLLKSALVTVTTLCGVAWVVLTLGPAAPHWVVLCAAALAGAPLWLASVLLTRHPLLDESRRLLSLRRAGKSGGAT